MTYYISASGDDAASGTTPTEAWRTLRRVAELELGPGDRILLEVTSEWDEQLEIRASGSAESPVVVAPYSDSSADTPVMPGWEDGVSTLRRPRIRFDAGPVVTAVDSSHLIIRGLEIECASSQTLYPSLDGVDDPSAVGEIARHPSDTVNHGILVRNSRAGAEKRGGPFEGITIEENYVHGRGPDQNSEGILVSAETTTDATGPTVTDVVIRNNLVEQVGWRGIGTGMQSIEPGFEGEPWKAIGGVDIENNAARLIGLQGICAFNSHRVVMRRNLVDRAGWYRGVGAKWGPAGLWPWSSADVLIEFNEVTGMFDGNTGADATGIDIDWNSRDVIVRSNHCYENMGCGIVTMSCLRGAIERNRIEGNLAKVNLGPGQIGICDYQNARGPHAITGVTDVDITENLIILDRDNTTALSTDKTSEGPAWRGVRFTGNRVVFFDHARGQYAYDIQPQTRIDELSANTFYGITKEEFRATESGGEHRWQEWADAENDNRSEFAALDDTAPSRVRELAAERTSDGIELRWQPAADTRSGVHHYNVYRGDRARFQRRYLTLAGQPAEPRFTDSDPAVLSSDKAVWYAVEAEDACGNRSGHVEVVVVAEKRAR